MSAYNELDPVCEILDRLLANLLSANPRYDLAVDDAISVLRIAHHLNATRLQTAPGDGGEQ